LFNGTGIRFVESSERGGWLANRHHDAGTNPCKPVAGAAAFFLTGGANYRIANTANRLRWTGGPGSNAFGILKLSATARRSPNSRLTINKAQLQSIAGTGLGREVSHQPRAPHGHGDRRPTATGFRNNIGSTDQTNSGTVTGEK